MNKKGYLLAELTITDPSVFYEDYMTKVKPILKKFEAKFLVATDSPEVIEGERVVPRVIFLEFSSVEKAREFYYSPEYEDIIDFRFKSSSAHLYILDGLPG
ncbi:DUF1330 domain-containing protein [Pseudomonas sp. RIT288]|jgi:uncharacterized protein (DUF1330 family)|uniref:DUF1330 domain-containing protein n=1 Tax=Pseudomonas sp. RIT288 TaxID=1470589 RepID=UPI000446EA95|nr:DUF1330 domain-containing protein [Pseudomonas sp. RIT288]EZP26619.1 hypothetical protein BW33_05037 [Pseudomonas sp. RIT288]